MVALLLCRGLMAKEDLQGLGFNEDLEELAKSRLQGQSGGGLGADRNSTGYVAGVGFALLPSSLSLSLRGSRVHRARLHERN